jgi:uncharacterized protein YjbI with pentapeptide repeats
MDKIELSSEEFLNRLVDSDLKKAGGISLLKDIIVADDVEIPNRLQSINSNPYIVLKNINFKNLQFRNTQCSNIQLDECSADKLEILLSQDIASIKIHNSCIREITILSPNKISHLSIGGSDAIIGRVTIDGDVVDLHVVKGHINELIIGGNWRNSNISNVHIAHLTKRVDIKFYSIVVTTRIEISRIEGTVIFSKSILRRFDGFSLDKSEIGFDDTNVEDFFLLRSDYVGLYFRHGETKNVSLQENSYKEIQFEGRGKHDFLLTPEKQEIISCNLLTLKNLVLEGAISFNNVHFESIHFNKIKNKGVIEFDYCEVKDSFKIINSTLGISIWNNLKVGKEKLVLTDSNIDQAIFTNFKWDNYKLNERDNSNQHYYKGEKEERFKTSLREAYRQLKNAYIKQGNKIEALEFQRRELEIHYSIINSKKWSSVDDFSNFLIVGTNKWFSDFGQNIWRPLLFLFILHFIFFNCMLFANKDVGYTIGWPHDWSALCKSISLYFQTLLPTHHHLIKNYMDKDVSIAGFWDFLMRVSAGYFIFYFVTASRKYHS